MLGLGCPAAFPSPWGGRRHLAVEQVLCVCPGTWPSRLCLGPPPSSCRHPASSWPPRAATDPSGEEPLPGSAASSTPGAGRHLAGVPPSPSADPHPAPPQALRAAGGPPEAGARGGVVSPPALRAEGGGVPARGGRRGEVSPEHKDSTRHQGGGEKSRRGWWEGTERSSLWCLRSVAGGGKGEVAPSGQWGRSAGSPGWQRGQGACLSAL